jgi:hypothetical protein
LRGSVSLNNLLAEKNLVSNKTLWYPETGKQKAVGVIVALLVNYFLPRERVVVCWEKVKGLFRPLEHS